MANRTKLTAKKRQEFLGALAAGDTVKHAAAAIGLARGYVYQLREADAAFRAEWEAAYVEGTEAIEQEIKRRGVDGWDEPVYQGGQKVGVVRKHSDTLLIFLAKGRDPERWRENISVEQKGRVQHDHTHSGRIDLRQATASELEVLEALAVRSHANGVAHP